MITKIGDIYDDNYENENNYHVMNDNHINNKIISPKDMPDFVKVGYFKLIDWERKATNFGDQRIIGNKNKSGILGFEASSANTTSKWMWLLWGIKDADKLSQSN